MESISRESLTETQRFWLRHLESCEASGMSLASYAAEHDLRVGSLYVWKSKLKRLGLLGVQMVETGFDEVSIEQPAMEPEISCSIRLPNGCEVDLGGFHEHTALVTVITAVASLP